ncbi:MAG: CHAT domain-containing protein [Acidobacteriota bacterium]|nr:CHAT domain-containing protein [Acidobacteriota bacterium]
MIVIRRSQDPYLNAEALHWRSRVEAALGRREAALRDLAEARAINATGSSETIRAQTAADIDAAEGEVRLAFQPEIAVGVLGRAVGAFAGQYRPIDEVLTRLTRARAFVALGRLPAARTDLAVALELFERQRRAIDPPSFRVSFSEASQSLFDQMMLAQAERGGTAEQALAIAERARTVPAEGLPSAGRSNLAKPAGTFDRRCLPADTSVVEYALAGDRLLVWTVRRDGVELLEDRVVPPSFERSVQGFIDAVRAGASNTIATASTVLYPYLIPAGVENLPASVRLVFVPDRYLNGVPFSALKNPSTGRYLVEDRATSIAPSATRYLSCLGASATRGRASWSALEVSNPRFDPVLFPALRDLPAAAREGAAARQLYADVLVLAGTEATRARVLAEIDRHQVLTFAGHATFNPSAPEDSPGFWAAVQLAGELR